MNLIHEIFRSKWLLPDSIVDAYKPRLIEFLKGGAFFDDTDKPEKLLNMFDTESDGEASQEKKGTVGIIDISGVLTKYGGLCSYGTREIAQMICEVENNDDYRGGILQIDSPGGSTSSVFPLETELSKRKKPWVSLVDMAASGGYYTTSFTDHIMASNKMAEFGSIGAMSLVVDDSERNEKEGIKIHRIYPKSSSYKNKDTEELLKNGNDALIQEDLEKWATHFQGIIKQNRPGLDLSVEGLIEGKMFYAYEAVKNGLVDSIGNIHAAVEWIDKELLKREITENI